MDYYDTCLITLPKVNNRTSTPGKVDLIERLAMEAIAPPRECPELYPVSDVRKRRCERIAIPVEITV